MHHLGTVEEGEKVLTPLRTVDQPLADLSAPQTYVAVDKPTMEHSAYPGRNAPFFLAAEANWNDAAEMDTNVA